MQYTEEQYLAMDRVKIGEFYKRGYVESHPIRGVLHVGANDGYEFPWYRQLGVEYITGFEPGNDAYKRLVDRHLLHGSKFVHAALGNMNGRTTLYLAQGDGTGSSLLPVVLPTSTLDYTPSHQEQVQLYRFADWAGEVGFDDPIDCMVIDTQGTELDVLRGMDRWIEKVNYLNVECSARPEYVGGVWADEVVWWLAKHGFVPIMSISVHDDVLFVRKEMEANPIVVPTAEVKEIPSGNKLNVGSGQRPFDQRFGWINVDINPRWKPDVLADWNNLTMFDDESMDLVVSHHSLEHVGCGEGNFHMKQVYRVLRPGGSFIVFVPDMKALAQRYVLGQMEEYLYMVNVYGAYQGDEADRHKWGYSRQGLYDLLKSMAAWKEVIGFNWRQIEGADIARDWWILGMEAVK